MYHKVHGRIQKNGGEKQTLMVGEAYPVATLKDGRRINVFWLVPMKTQRD